MGVRCSIDDFGTGYSNIGYLHEFPITTVKLDRSFVQHRRRCRRGLADRARGDRAGAQPGLRVVAEGVETRDQMGFLQAHGCDELQGFLFSPGVPAGEMTALLRGGVADDPWTRLPWLPSGTLEEWDEKRLQEALWSSHGAGLRQDDDPDVRGTRVMVMGTASGFMVLPTLLGLGSAGGLPPEVQVRWTSAFSAAGVVTAHDPAAPSRGRAGR